MCGRVLEMVGHGDGGQERESLSPMMKCASCNMLLATKEERKLRMTPFLSAAEFSCSNIFNCCLKTVGTNNFA